MVLLAVFGSAEADWWLSQNACVWIEPDKVAGPLDFVSVHLYPESDKLAASLDTLKGFGIGTPAMAGP